jgi:NAD(P)-dependent dehydrogenase (short-subunit alcohol dehydrogenase family)
VASVQARFGLTPDAALAQVVEDNPMKRMIAPAEVVAVALFLASAGASMVNGHALSVSGGEI